MAQKRGEPVDVIKDVRMDLPNFERFIGDGLKPFREDLASEDHWKRWELGAERIADGVWRIDWEFDVVSTQLGYVKVLAVGEKLSTILVYTMEWDTPRESRQVVSADGEVWESLDTTKTYDMWARDLAKRIRYNLQTIGALPADEPTPTEDAAGGIRENLMTHSQPSITGTTHTLPFDKLSPRDFERLCLWLVEREGYERAEHLGAAGSEQGRDIVAWREGALWAFQCKRVQRFGPRDALAEVEKVLVLPQNQRPVGLVFLVTCDVSANTRQQVRERCAGEMECHFWTGTEFDEKVKRHTDILEEFFQADRGSTIIETGGRAVVADRGGVAAGQVAVGGDVHGDIYITGDRWEEDNE
jgi:hypothetical protein